MIEELREEEIVKKVGGRFKLTSLIQKRWLEIMRGSRALVDTTGKTEMEVVIEEILQGKIDIDYEASGMRPPNEDER